MVKNPLIGKCLTVGIILLFICVAIAPSINHSVVKASQDDDLVEVTTQAYGIKGYGNTTVKLTKEQYQDMEQYLVDFRARLNQTTTREEAVPIFREAVMELDKYGLLPEGMGVERAQQLVIGRSPNIVTNKLQEKSLSSDIYNNLFFLIAGRGKEIGVLEFIGSIWYIFYGIGLFFYAIFLILNDITHLFTIPYIFFTSIVSTLDKIGTRLWNYLDKRLIVFGSDIFYWRGYSNGWIHTFGLLGNKNISGDLEGVLPYYIPGFRNFLILQGDTGRGVSGFNGIRIYSEDDVVLFYIGNALQMRIKVT
jgi:hypothetical protein